MRKKFLLSIFVFILPFLSFAQEKDEGLKQEEVSAENSSDDEIAMKAPYQEDLNTDETSKDILPTNDSDISQTNTFPIETTFGYNLEDANSNYFLQAAGTDILNDKKDRKINFLIKVPYLQLNDTSNKLAVIPDKFSINFIDPFLNIALGDNTYDMSPLTIKNRKKRGGICKIDYKDKAGISTLYLLSKPTKDKNPSDNLGICFFIKPISFIKLAPNFLYTKFKEEKFSIPKNNSSYSLRSSIFLDDKNKLDLETAITNKLNKKHLAYFANLDGKSKYFTYLINWVYANPKYVGKYTDKTKLNSSIKYELNDLAMTLAHNYKNQNLNKLILKENAKRSRKSEFNISYPILSPIKTNVALKSQESKNLLTRDGYKLNAITLNTSIPIKNYTIDNTLELGKYRSRTENYISRNWAQGKLFLKYNPTEESCFAFYTKLGNLLYDDIFTLSYVFGTDLKINPIKNFDLTLVYEYSINRRNTLATLKDKKPKWKGNYFKQDLTYILPNEHKISLSSHLNKPLDEKKEKTFLLTYTIPFQVPNVNRTLNTIRNSLF